MSTTKQLHDYQAEALASVRNLEEPTPRSIEPPALKSQLTGDQTE